MHELYSVDDVAMAINYGFPVGAKIGARSTIADVKRLDGAAQATMVTTVEIDGVDKPAAAIESVVRYVG